jgi:hypothetical protein
MNCIISEYPSTLGQQKLCYTSTPRSVRSLSGAEMSPVLNTLLIKVSIATSDLDRILEENHAA